MEVGDQLVFHIAWQRTVGDEVYPRLVFLIVAGVDQLAVGKGLEFRRGHEQAIVDVVRRQSPFELEPKAVLADRTQHGHAARAQGV